MSHDVIVDALPYIDTGYDEPGVREAAIAMVEDEKKRYRPTKNYLEHLPPLNLSAFEPQGSLMMSLQAGPWSFSSSSRQVLSSCPSHDLLGRPTGLLHPVLSGRGSQSTESWSWSRRSLDQRPMPHLHWVKHLEVDVGLCNNLWENYPTVQTPNVIIWGCVSLLDCTQCNVVGSVPAEWYCSVDLLESTGAEESAIANSQYIAILHPAMWVGALIPVPRNHFLQSPRGGGCSHCRDQLPTHGGQQTSRSQLDHSRYHIFRKEIQELNWSRKNMQTKAGEELRHLESSWVSLVSRNYEIEQACVLLEAEIVKLEHEKETQEN
ncbi:uncharacterized protein LOC125045302 [Penaeus chinensis]|uniref:uncharacterized protein LOC125045302 n=1 Tax=Penaeus chinensis TaxID=139456 RepID=UPI001FB6875F|nr:uncharacterized protein LOC125045302 [Penaeus chinensis]